MCSGALLASDGLSTSPSDEWHQAGEDWCVAKRLPGILFLPNGSVWCQEDDPPAGTLFRLYRKGGGSCEQMSFSYDNSNGALELNVASGLQAGCTFQNWYKVCPASILEFIEERGVLIGSTLLGIP